MNPAIWTSIYIEHPIVEVLARLHTQGWHWCELSCEHIAQITAAGETAIQEVTETLSQLGMQMPQAHLYLQANVVHNDPDKREAEMQRVLRELETAGKLGVENAVLHPGGEALPELLERRVTQFRRIADQAEAFGVRIALENMMDGRDRQRYGARIAELHDLIDAVGSPNLGICFDTSHANVQKLDLPKAIRACGDRLIATHISDNDGSGDQHRIPGYGRIEWPSVIQALQDVGYEGVFNLEIPGERWPEILLDLKTVHAREVVERLLNTSCLSDNAG